MKLDLQGGAHTGYVALKSSRTACPRGVAVTLGCFDGLHLGHMYLINMLARSAARHGLPALVYTFSEHPQNVFSRSKRVKLLTPADKKIELLSGTAADGVYFEDFTREFAELAPEEFVRTVLAERFGARLVVVGSNFRFGRRAGGCAADLEKLGARYGFGTQLVPPVPTGTAGSNNAAGGFEKVSSSLIREHIESGNVELAAPLLGRLYSLSGSAISIAGREVNAMRPDARMELAMRPDARMALPEYGAYATCTKIKGRLINGYSIICGGGGSGGGSGGEQGGGGSGGSSGSDGSGSGEEQGGRIVENFLSERVDDLHIAQIDIFFYKRVHSEEVNF